MKLYDISGEQFSAMDAPRHLMTEEGTAQTTLDRSLGICQVAELEGKVTREVLEEVMEEDCERLLIRGDAQITRDGQITWQRKNWCCSVWSRKLSEMRHRGMMFISSC